ncbi:MAG TPA: efflux RND transporter periplasmic adaptor subunit [Magnetospirillaceae bacterium]|nr:efflux RND transporter periplasmic adaptor subunit [Magnetospirillaceae bacterium]
MSTGTSKIRLGKGLRAALTLAVCAALAALTTIALSSCPGARRDAPAETQEPAVTVVAVETVPVVLGSVRDSIFLSGDIVASSAVDAHADVAGRVTRHFVNVGQRVQRDQDLIEVDPSRPGMSFQPSVIRSPIAGTVTSLPMEVGATLSPSVPAARIARTEDVELRTYAPERFVSRMRPGLASEVSLAAWPGEVFHAVLRDIAPVLDPASRTLELRLAFRRADPRVKAGMFATVKVITETRASVVKVPAEASVRRFGETFAFVAEADPDRPGSYLARRRTLVPGILADGVLEVREGLAAGEHVVVRGQTLLDEGVPVNVVLRRPSVE